MTSLVRASRIIDRTGEFELYFRQDKTGFADFRGVFQWCRENCSGTFTRRFGSISFSEEDDATLCLLRFR
jgi:hypothetical protein